MRRYVGNYLLEGGNLDGERDETGGRAHLGIRRKTSLNLKRYTALSRGRSYSNVSKEKSINIEVNRLRKTE